MAKKKAKKTSNKYKSFEMHGSYPTQKIFLYVFLDLLISFALGVLLQPFIVQTLASTVAGH